MTKTQAYALATALVVTGLFLFTACADRRCIDNPRNMSCMTADELTKELSK